MRGLVSQESDLCEEDAECSGGEQLEPAVAEKDESGDAAPECERQRDPDEAVEPACSTEEPALAHDLRPVGVRACDRGKSAVRAYVCLTGLRRDAAVEEMSLPAFRSRPCRPMKPTAVAER